MSRGKKIALVLAGLVALALVVAGVWVVMRVNSYQALLRYLPDRDYVYDLEQTQARLLEVAVDRQGFVWPADTGPWDTGFLRLSLRATLAGRLEEPYIEVTLGQRKFRQYFERGARGARYLNLSPLAADKHASGQRVGLSGRNVTWAQEPASLALFDNHISRNARILVLAPHPDDAEIAAFGFYSRRDAYLLTLTAGEAGEGYFQPSPAERRQRQMLKGRLRVWDSVSSAYWSGLDPSRACNLGYFDSTLAWMFKHPRQTVISPATQAGDPRSFRRCAWASLPRRDQPQATWESLVAELTHILGNLRPKIIVAPHPFLDSHPDHRYATLALLQALAKSGLRQGDLLLYTNHHLLTEMYPFGNDDGLVSLPPWFDGQWLFARVFSHQLGKTKVSEKYFALEAMHDLRGPPEEQNGSLKLLGKGLDRAVEEALDLEDATSYFRRAVRPNELFYVTPVDMADRLERETRKALGLNGG